MIAPDADLQDTFVERPHRTRLRVPERFERFVAGEIVAPIELRDPSAQALWGSIGAGRLGHAWGVPSQARVEARCQGVICSMSAWWAIACGTARAIRRFTAHLYIPVHADRTAPERLRAGRVAHGTCHRVRGRSLS
jgi:hypothetical protein